MDAAIGPVPMSLGSLLYNLLCNLLCNLHGSAPIQIEKNSARAADRLISLDDRSGGPAVRWTMLTVVP